MTRKHIEILTFLKGNKDNVCVVELLQGKGTYYVYVSQGKRAAKNIEQVAYTALEDLDSALEAFNSEVEFKIKKGYRFLTTGDSIEIPWFASLQENQKILKVFNALPAEEHRKLAI